MPTKMNLLYLKKVQIYSILIKVNDDRSDADAGKSTTDLHPGAKRPQ